MVNDPMYNEDVTRVGPPKPISGDEGPTAGGLGGGTTTPFNLSGGKAGGAGLEEAPSPLDVSAAQNPASSLRPATTESLMEQAQQITGQMNNAQNLLQTPNFQLKSSVSNLLLNHTQAMTNGFNTINSRLNLPAADLPQPSSGLANVSYFLNYIAGSQQQLKHLTDSLQNAPKGSITPGTLLAVQVKMNSIQQQVEFFTVMLGKAVDNFKTIMNIQS